MQKLLVVVEKVLPYKILTKSTCIYCTRAKMLFNQKGIAFEEKLVSDPQMLEYLKRQGHKTFPIIYDPKDNLIGGFLELADYLHELET